MSAVVEKDVLGLEVTINNLESVQTFQGTEQLCGVETRAVDIETLFSLKMMEQLTTVDESQDKVQLLR